MKWTKFFPLILIAALISSCNQPKSKTDNTVISGKQMYADTSASSVRVFDQNGRVCIQQTNTYYEMVNAFDTSGKIPLLVKIRKTDLCYADSVNHDKVYEISAKSVLDTKPVEWTAEFVGSDLQFKDNTVYGVHEGDVNEEDLIKRFSLMDGKQIFECSYGDAKVLIPNVRDKRFVGFTSRKAVTQPLKSLNEENLVGIIEYSSSYATHNKFEVKLKRSKVTGKMPSSTPDINLVPADANSNAVDEGKSLIMTHLDEHYQPGNMGNFAVKFTFYYGDDNEATDIIIPVVNDQLDLAHAKYDHDIFEISPS